MTNAEIIYFVLGTGFGFLLGLGMAGLCWMGENTQDRIIHHSRVDEHAEGLENESQKSNQ